MATDQGNDQEIPRVQRISSVLWPSFLTAGIANSFFFTFFEADALLYAAGIPPVSNIAAYSIGFFLFWLLTSVSSAATSYFLKPCHKQEK